MPQLTGVQRKALFKAIVDTVGSEDEFARCLLFECELKLRDIAKPGPIPEMVYAVIERCESQGGIPQLIEGMTRSYPNSPALNQFMAIHWRRSTAPASTMQQVRFETPVPKYAPVCGITAGLTHFDQVQKRLGVPPVACTSGGKLEVNYQRDGLLITFDGALDENPCVEHICVDASIARELPLGLRRDMLRAEWDRILCNIYGPSRERFSAGVATYVPRDGSPGNTVRIIVTRDDSGRIELVNIYS